MATQDSQRDGNAIQFPAGGESGFMIHAHYRTKTAHKATGRSGPWNREAKRITPGTTPLLPINVSDCCVIRSLCLA